MKIVPATSAVAAAGVGSAVAAAALAAVAAALVVVAAVAVAAIDAAVAAIAIDAASKPHRHVIDDNGAAHGRPVVLSATRSN